MEGAYGKILVGAIRSEVENIGRLSKGDIVIHYRTSRASPYPMTYVGFSKVKSPAKNVSLEQLKKHLIDSGIFDDKYEKFFIEKTKK